MFKTLLSLLFVAVAIEGNILKSDENLKFNVISSRSIDEPPTVEVTFANGVKDSLELSHYKMHERAVVGCNYHGSLKNDPSAVVAVTGCLNKPGDKMEVTLISKNNINKMFTVDFNGNAEIIRNPFEAGAESEALSCDREDGWREVNGDEEKNDEEENAAHNARTTSIPSKLKATIQFGYEDGMKAALGTEDFDAWVQTVMVHTQTHYRHAESLGTTIEFEVVGTPSVHKAGVTWYADDNIYDARTASNENSGTHNPDIFAWWSASGGGGVAGIAFVGVLCSSYHTSLNEKQNSAAGSGFVLAHELGHNFGMSHDFDESHGGQNGPCNGQGIMSYGSYDYDQWSTCSRSDWEQHYTSMNWGATCLEDISDETDSPTTAGPTAAPGPEVCFDVKTVTKNWGHEIEWNIGGSTHASCENEQRYENDQEYTQQCCLPKDQSEFAITCKDTYGDGWHGGYLEIEGEKYCEEFTNGDELSDTLPNPSPESPEVCTSIKLVTKRWGNEISWSFGACNSSQEYGNHNIYTQQCCQPAGSYPVTCKDSYGDGWHGGYLKIEGKKYCKRFKNGHEKTEEGTMAGDGTSPTQAPTAAPTGGPNPTAGPTNAPPTTECGINPGAIVGGSEVTPYSLPWQVGLVSPGSARTWCGGTLIGPQHVLTAAHCMGGNFEVVVGEHSITDSSDGTRHTVCSTTSHPQYNTGTSTNYDYAIVRLSQPVELGPRAVPACLPGADLGGSYLDDKTMTVSGWGTTASGGSQAQVLMSVDVPGVTNAKCQQSYGESSITDAMLCAGRDEGGVDSCQGDSGGPLTFTHGTPARTYVVGVVSWGAGCADAGYPGVYARVTHVSDWINEQMAITC